MAVINVITDELNARAGNIGQYAETILNSQNDMLAIFQGLGRDLSGSFPHAVIQQILGMRRSHTEMNKILLDYKDFLAQAATQYEWSEKELAKWAQYLGGSGTDSSDSSSSAGTTGSSSGSAAGAHSDKYVPQITPDIANSPYYHRSEGEVNVNQRMLYNEYAKENRVNCVYYARARAMEVNGWDEYPATTTGSELRSGSIAWFKTPYGDHAVYVENVDPTTGTVCYSDSNMARHPDGEINYTTIDDFRSLYDYSLVNYEYPSR